MNFGRVANTVIIIVSYRNPSDVVSCLTALAQLDPNSSFDVFICENGGEDHFRQLVMRLANSNELCSDGVLCELTCNNYFSEMAQFRLLPRASRVSIGCAFDNLGYAGGINVWLRVIESLEGWDGVWILNPDTEPKTNALAALIERAQVGGIGMVGSTILEAGSDDIVRFRGGLHWQKFLARPIAVGIGESLDATCDLAKIESTMDSLSGASMYVTRSCIERIGLMNESYFLFFEDLDWGVRAKGLGLGYAKDSVVTHKRGTTTGSARNLAAVSRLAVYLEHRNGIHFVRRHFSHFVALRIIVSLLYAARFLFARSPKNCLAVFDGVVAGLRGELGKPGWYQVDNITNECSARRKDDFKLQFPR